MTAWDVLVEEYPAVGERVYGELLPFFREVSRAQPPADLLVAFGLDPTTAEAVADAESVGGGLRGVGAWIPEPGAPPLPVLSVIEELAPDGPTSLGASPVAPWWGQILPDDVLLVGSGPSDLQADLRIGSVLATRGAWAVDRTNGSLGFLTAGHAAGRVGTPVVDVGTGAKVGHVERTSFMTVAQDEAVADVALVRWAGGPELTIWSWPSRSAHRSDRVCRCAPPHAEPGPEVWFSHVLVEHQVTPGCWLGAVCQTSTSISTRSDSGAPVFATADGALLGHIVAGGKRGDFSVVQDIDYQLTAIDATLA